MILIEATDTDFEDLINERSPRNLTLPDGGVERPDVLTMLRVLANSIRANFAPASWMMVAEQEVVGLCSIVKPPQPDRVYIGYGVAISRRSRGFATAGVGALLNWARDDRRLLALMAETSVKNLPSQRVLQRNGFARIGHRVDDEDGELICWSAATEA